jgi:hypothetical protein
MVRRMEEYEFIYENDPVRAFLENEGELPPLLREAGIRAMLRDFSAIADQDSADRLLAELIHFGNSNGFDLRRNDVFGGDRSSK